MPAVNQYEGCIESAEIRPLGSVRKGFTYFADGDVIFAKITPCMQNGKAAIATNLENGLGFGSTEFHVLRPDTAKITPEWIWHFVRQGSYRREARHHFQGAVGQQRVPASFLEGTIIPLPPLREQRRIVARIKECLDRVEEIETLRSESLKESAATLPSLLSEAFDKLASEHEAVEIGDVSLETRYGTSRKCTTQSSGTPILRIPNVIDGSINFENLKHCPLEKLELQRVALRKGDLLFVRTNGSRELVGRCAIFEQESDDQTFGFASYLIRVRLDSTKMLPHFLAFFLNSTHGRIELNKRRRTSAGQFNINSENLRSIKLPLPPLHVQKRLVETFREYSLGIAKLAREMEESNLDEEHLRDSILRKAFAGEL
jgi:type I restriction enzyme S subunit